MKNIVIDDVLAQIKVPIPKTLNGCFRVRQIQAGQIVLWQGEPVEEVQLLVQGELLIEAQFPSGNSLIFSSENGVSVLGDIEILSENLTYASTVIAKTDIVLLTLSIENFQNWMQEEPEFQSMVIRSLAKKCYRQSTNQGVMTYIPPVRRLARFLAEELVRNPSPSGIVRCSHAELGRRTGMSERTVNRALSELRNMNVIHTEYGKIYADEPKLHEILADL